MLYYAVYKGHSPGVYNNWEECRKQIYKYSGAIYKKFKQYDEAEHFYKNGLNINNINKDIHEEYDITIYTDGSCYGNGKVPSFGGYGIYTREKDIPNIAKAIKGNCTNNIAELKAILKVFKICKQKLEAGKKILIVSDSLYSIDAITKRSTKYKEDNWNNTIPNINLIKKIYKKYSKYNNIFFKHIYSHTNLKDTHSIGNAKADELANDGLIQCIKSSDKLGEIKFTFGKYKNFKLCDVNDPEYIKFLLDKYNKDKAFVLILKTYY